MAPEVALSKPYNEMSDIYSYGIIMWQVDTGFVPFAGMAPSEFVSNVVKGKQRPRDDVISKLLRQLIPQCWDDDFKKRPKASEIRDTFKNILLSAPAGSSGGAGDGGGCCIIG
jgi:serine/threonine protein kinase